YGYKPYTPLAGERLQPLGHLTVLRRHILRFTKNMSNIFLAKTVKSASTVGYLIKAMLIRSFYNEHRFFTHKKGRQYVSLSM
ncbi:MAG: hypothetical protein AAGJ67_18060, partial [Pseudomonadota bacterium]